MGSGFWKSDLENQNHSAPAEISSKASKLFWESRIKTFSPQLIHRADQCSWNIFRDFYVINCYGLLKSQHFSLRQTILIESNNFHSSFLILSFNIHTCSTIPAQSARS